MHPRVATTHQWGTLDSAVLLGVKCFGLVFSVFCLAAIVLVVAANGIQMALRTPNPELWHGVAGSLLLSIPIVALVGAISGHENYRFAAGSSRVYAGQICLMFLPLPFVVVSWKLCVALLGGSLIFVIAHHDHRSKAKQDKRKLWRRFLLIGGLLVSMMVLTCGQELRALEYVIPGYAFGSLFLSDAILAHCMADWRKHGLIKEAAYPFQFSMKMLLLLCLGAGAYMVMLTYFHPLQGLLAQ